jgi:hypothetical protein
MTRLWKTENKYDDDSNNNNNHNNKVTYIF